MSKYPTDNTSDENMTHEIEVKYKFTAVEESISQLQASMEPLYITIELVQKDAWSVLEKFLDLYDAFDIIKGIFDKSASKEIEELNKLCEKSNASLSEYRKALEILDGALKAVGDSAFKAQGRTKDLNKKFKEIGKSLGEGLNDGVKSVLNNIETTVNVTVKDAFTINKDSISAIENSFKRVGEYITAGIVYGMRSGNLDGETEETFEDVLKTVRKQFEVQSPSKVMERIGKYISEGLENGIRKGSDDVVDAARDLGDGIDDEIGGRDFSFGGLGAAFGVITAIGGAFTALMSSNEEFGAAVDEVWTQITEAFAPVTDAVTSLIMSFGEERMGGAFSWFAEALGRKRGKIIFLVV